MGTTLRYPYEIRDAKEYFDDISDVKLAPDMLKLAEHILATKEAKFDPSNFVDHYEEAVVEMLKRKQAGLPARRDQPSPPPSNVINLMDALRRSIAGERVTTPAAAAPPASKAMSSPWPIEVGSRTTGALSLIATNTTATARNASATATPPARGTGTTLTRR